MNLDGVENYVALDARTEGQMVGLVLEAETVAGGWSGEGGDMVFIDGDSWPPRLHGAPGTRYGVVPDGGVPRTDDPNASRRSDGPSRNP